MASRGGRSCRPRGVEAASNGVAQR